MVTVLILTICAKSVNTNVGQCFLLSFFAVLVFALCLSVADIFNILKVRRGDWQEQKSNWVLSDYIYEIKLN